MAAAIDLDQFDRRLAAGRKLELYARAVVSVAIGHVDLRRLVAAAGRLREGRHGRGGRNDLALELRDMRLAALIGHARVRGAGEQHEGNRTRGLAGRSVGRRHQRDQGRGSGEPAGLAAGKSHGENPARAAAGDENALGIGDAVPLEARDQVVDESQVAFGAFLADVPAAGERVGIDDDDAAALDLAVETEPVAHADASAGLAVQKNDHRPARALQSRVLDDKSGPLDPAGFDAQAAGGRRGGARRSETNRRRQSQTRQRRRKNSHSEMPLNRHKTPTIIALRRHCNRHASHTNCGRARRCAAAGIGLVNDPEDASHVRAVMAEANNPSQRLQDRRPLSPHLEIYKMMFTMVMSGLHRITGMCLYAGTLLLAWYF
ncbi:MAG: succinate:quinone oxidoreductase subunit C, partial [Hyphomicrobiales bacterium]|nr:succinate:quinone oxidoreductase subunit C [Hyphomicrobiales bacterium]